MRRRLLEEIHRVLEPFGGAGSAALHRIAASARIYCGAERRPPGEPQRPQILYVPGLAAHPWHDLRAERETAGLADRLAASWKTVRGEFLAVPPARSAPYEPGATAGVTGSWTSFDLQRKQRRGPIDTNCALVPATAALVEELAPVLFPGGEAIVSVLGPRSHIPAHYDSANFKLTCHLPVVVPPGCGLRVHGEDRTLVEGHPVLFDSSFLHEAWNPSEAPRACLVLDVWHPGLSAVERGALTAAYALIAADFYSRVARRRRAAAQGRPHGGTPSRKASWSR